MINKHCEKRKNLPIHYELLVCVACCVKKRQIGTVSSHEQMN